MRRIFSGLALVFTLMGPAFPPTAHAADTAISSKDERALQTVVRAQLDAFAADDAKLAFSYASPSIQTMFGSPDQFLMMVRSSYPVVYRHVSITFLKPKPDEKMMVQPVSLTDGDGRAWLAVYRLERLKNKSWRIAGCVLLPQSGQTI